MRLRINAKIYWYSCWIWLSIECLSFTLRLFCVTPLFHGFFGLVFFCLTIRDKRNLYTHFFSKSVRIWIWHSWIFILVLLKLNYYNLKPQSWHFFPWYIFQWSWNRDLSQNYYKLSLFGICWHFDNRHYFSLDISHYMTLLQGGVVCLMAHPYRYHCDLLIEGYLKPFTFFFLINIKLLFLFLPLLCVQCWFSSYIYLCVTERIPQILHIPRQR